jgi:excisionase family DNA binding protein
MRDAVSQPDTSTRLLTAAEVAKELRVSIRHVRRLADAGEMPRPLRLGRVVRWSEAELIRWIAGGCPAAEGSAE